MPGTICACCTGSANFAVAKTEFSWLSRERVRLLHRQQIYQLSTLLFLSAKRTSSCRVISWTTNGEQSWGLDGQEAKETRANTAAGMPIPVASGLSRALRSSQKYTWFVGTVVPWRDTLRENRLPVTKRLIVRGIHRVCYNAQYY